LAALETAELAIAEPLVAALLDMAGAELDTTAALLADALELVVLAAALVLLEPQAASSPVPPRAAADRPAARRNDLRENGSVACGRIRGLVTEGSEL
jgi:hypothetical protein